MAGRSEEILSFVSENNREHNEGQGEDRQTKSNWGLFCREEVSPSKIMS